jgi:anti-sigma factor RsiW
MAQATEVRALTQGPAGRHLAEEEAAAYVDGTLAANALKAIQAHLAICAECRAEVAEVSSIVRTAPAAKRARRIWIPAAAAAALALLWVAPRAARGPAHPTHREEAVTTTVAPRPVSPRGAVDPATTFVWSSVPYATAYRIRLYDADGSLLWEQETADTVSAPPTSLGLRARTSYYWKVEAQTGFGRWAASDLVEFVPAHGGGPR